MPISRIAGLSASSAPDGDAVVQPPAVDEEQPMPGVERLGRRVEAVLAADAVEHLDAAGVVEQPRPGEVGRQVGVELGQRRGHRTDDRAPRPGVAEDRRRLSRLVAGDEREPHPVVVFHRAVHRREHRVVHRRARVDQDAAAASQAHACTRISRVAGGDRPVIQPPPTPSPRARRCAIISRPATASAST